VKSSSLAGVVLAVVVGLAGEGCAGCGQRFLGVIEGPINDPANRSLRRTILGWGLSEFCNEVRARNAPLALSPDSPVIGRFYPEQCVQREGADGNLVVDITGRGYAWTNIAHKTTFFARAGAEYNQDFLMDGSTMYAYFRTSKVQASDFRITLVEQPAAAVVQQLSGLGDTFGRQLLTGKLSEGFTVVREASGAADFAPGMLARGQKPFRPTDVKGEDRVTYENLRTEVHQNQRDFIGPVKVEGKGRALYVTATVDGAPQIDVLILDAREGKASLDLYLGYAMVGPLAGQSRPLVSETARAGVPYARTIPVPEGVYYVVFDNTPSAGPSSPPTTMFDDRAASIRYAVQVGDEP